MPTDTNNTAAPKSPPKRQPSPDRPASPTQKKAKTDEKVTAEAKETKKEWAPPKFGTICWVEIHATVNTVFSFSTFFFIFYFPSFKIFSKFQCFFWIL